MVPWQDTLRKEAICERRANHIFSSNRFPATKKIRRCVNRYNGNYRVRSFTCHGQFLCVAFAQLTYRESLRDIACCLHAMREKLYHMGIRGNVSRSTLAKANENPDWRIYSDFAQILIPEPGSIYVMDRAYLDLQRLNQMNQSSAVFVTRSKTSTGRCRIYL